MNAKTAIVDLTPDEIVRIIEENRRLKAAIQEATAAFLYLNGISDDDWNALPAECYTVPESAPGACDGGIASGQSTYRNQANDPKWVAYWIAIAGQEVV